MTYARHLPTQTFTADEFNAMPAYPIEFEGIAGDGFSRFSDRRGKAIVVFIPPAAEWALNMATERYFLSGSYTVRPIVRVPVRRCVV